MPVGVIDRLEIVHIHKDERHVFLVHALEHHLVGAPVEEPGQTVVRGLMT